MAAVLADAKRLGAPVDEALDACAAVWRSWAGRLREWSGRR
jgi:hypothetical protein